MGSSALAPQDSVLTAVRSLNCAAALLLSAATSSGPLLLTFCPAASAASSVSKPSTSYSTLSPTACSRRRPVA
eukprot:474405-Rhodomonas_salina.2